jgi:MFS family permease
MFGFTLLAISFLQTPATSAASPALGRIAAEFAPVAMTTVQMVMTLPSICIIIMSFLVVRLLNRCSLKTVMMTGVALYLIGGFGPFFSTGIYMLLALRAVMGLGLGIIGPLLPIAVSGRYEGVPRAKMMGYIQSSNFLGGILGTVMGGVLAGMGWRNIFWLYLLAIPALLLSIPYLKTGGSKASALAAQAPAAAKVPFNGAAIFLGVSMLLHAMFFFKAPLTMAMYLPSIGVQSTAASGIAVGVLYGGSLLAGLIVVPLGKILKDAKIPFVFLIEAIAYLLLCRTQSLSVVCVATGLLGFGNGIFAPSWFARVPEKLHGPLVPKTMTLVNTMLFLGMFLTPYLSAFVKSVGTNTIQFDFMVVAICEVLMLLGAIVIALRDRKRVAA